MRGCPCAHSHRPRATPDAGGRASSAEAGKVPERTGAGAGPRDVVQSPARVGGFPPTGGLAPRRPPGPEPATEEGAGLGRGPMGARAGAAGAGRARGAGPGGRGSNERAPRPGPAGARDAAERLVANVTVCKPRGVVKGAGLGARCRPRGYVCRRVCPRAGAAGAQASGSGGGDGDGSRPPLLEEATC